MQFNLLAEIINGYVNRFGNTSIKLVAYSQVTIRIVCVCVCVDVGSGADFSSIIFLNVTISIT